MLWWLFGVMLIIFEQSLPTIASRTGIVEERLRTDLFQTYNKDLRPPVNRSSPLTIFADFYLAHIVDVNEESGVLSVIGALNLIWKDDRIFWNPDNYSSIQMILAGDNEIWMPGIYALNQGGEFLPFGSDVKQLVIQNDGTFVWQLGTRIDTTFTSDMTYFPIDVQICRMIIFVGGYFPHEIVLQGAGNKMNMSAYQGNKQWEILDTAIRPFGYDGFNGMLQCEVKLKRRNLYYDVSIVSNLCILTIVNPMVFLLPIESGERASFSVTMLLTFGIFLSQMSSYVPKVSYPLPLIAYLLLTVLVTSAGNNIIVIVTSYLYNKKTSTKAPRWLTLPLMVLTLGFIPKLIALCTRNKNMVEEIDLSNWDENEKIKQGQNRYTSWQDVAKSLDLIAFVYYWICFLFAFVSLITLHG